MKLGYGSILNQSFETSPVLDNYFTKDETLTSTTSALFGLGSDAVPDDVFKLFANGIKAEVGSYTGTGTYGSSNKNIITFFEKPIAVVVKGRTVGSGGFVWTYGCSSGPSMFYNNTFPALIIEWTNNSISWFSTAASNVQLNDYGKQYDYVVLIPVYNNT